MSLGLAAAVGVNFAAGFLKGRNEGDEEKAKAATYLQDAELYRRNARIARLTGAYNEDIARSQQRAAVAKSAAAAGEAGMGESTTTMTALMTTYNALEQNILSARFQVESEAENYLYQARVADENARQANKKAKHKYQQALLSGASSALSALKF
ncbi:MAG: hypothetical protein NC218_10980 [Acetobacter sp.]|nr:hypothetical protein [Acetobacter sp.]